MRLARATEIAYSLARLPVPGDAEGLLKHVLVSDAVPDGWSLSLAYPEALFVRPVEALHLLSLVTSHAYSCDDLHDAYAWWGMLRYLGFFDLDVGDQEYPALRLSDAGKRIAGAQRRVTSEELGIGFGVLAASMHLRAELAPGTPVGIVDVDLVLGGSGHGCSRRPDYLLVVGADEASPRGMVRSVECKGTKDPVGSGKQLTTAVRQLAEPVLGYVLPGLAVSTVTGDRQVSCVALELANAENEEASPQVTEALTTAALRASWSMLAHYAGNQAAEALWSSKRRANRRETRSTFESDYGPAVGVTTAFDFDDRQLVVTWALDKRVDDALATGDPQAVLAAQQAFAADQDRIAPRELPAGESGALADAVDIAGQAARGRAADSVMPDGSIFSVAIR